MEDAEQGSGAAAVANIWRVFYTCCSRPFVGLDGLWDTRMKGREAREGKKGRMKRGARRGRKEELELWPVLIWNIVGFKGLWKRRAPSAPC